MLVFVILKWIMRRILRKHKVIGIENVVEGTGAVFVCNHAGSYGPIAIELFFPFRYRPWVIYHTMTKKLCRLRLEKDLFGGAAKFLKPLCQLLALAIEPICLWVMRRIEAIPVYSGRNDIFKTFNISIEALESGCNIVLFLETKKEFKTGFVHLARKYYEITGKILCFYPVYSDRKTRTITIGKPVDYLPGANFKEEETRIAKKIMEAICI